MAEVARRVLALGPAGEPVARDAGREAERRDAGDKVEHGGEGGPAHSPADPVEGDRDEHADRDAEREPGRREGQQRAGRGRRTQQGEDRGLARRWAHGADHAEHEHLEAHFGTRTSSAPNSISTAAK